MSAIKEIKLLMVFDNGQELPLEIKGSASFFL